ncbi:MAG TPA: NUDIX hydrolase [Verrucomicrobiae bacterium]|nr:NUDIX hydrolase [Verrucomicrobiae bacterium]
MLKDDWHSKCFYRVSIKAVIRNAHGQVLVVKEKNNPKWNLPGGGMDYGETEQEALRRELYEEVGYVGDFSYEPLGIEPMFLESKQAWQLWVVYDVAPAHFDFIVGEEADEIAFMDPAVFKKERPLIYKFAKKTNLDISSSSL